MGMSVEDEVRCQKSGYSIDMIVRDRDSDPQPGRAAPDDVRGFFLFFLRFYSPYSLIWLRRASGGEESVDER